MKKFSHLLFIACLFLVACQSSQPPVDLSEEIKAIENGLLKGIQVKGETPTLYNIEERMELHKVPGVSIAVVKDGKLRWAKGYGYANTETGKQVDTNTLFQAGSISKPVAALAALKLVEEGRIELDADVSNYLKTWQIPESKFLENEQVTLRRLLTHTAGMTVHGFPGYTQTDTFPSINDVLDGNGNTPAIYVDTLPGSIWRYSGGGYTVMEKIVEDVSGMPLEEYEANFILGPLGMENSTYSQPLSEELHAQASAAYDNEGNIIEGLWHNYPEQAAAGLWTTPSDLAKYCIEIQQALTGESEKVLSQDMVKQMLTKDKNDWGLGPSLAWDDDSLRFQHGGKNAGFTNNMIAFAHKGDAVIVMTGADNGGRIIGEILRAVSSHYGWGIAKPRVVETIELTDEALQSFVGDYKYVEQVPGIGDYIISISVKNGQLVAFDQPEEQYYTLTALADKKFLDLDKGDGVEFTEDENSVGFLWNGNFRFERISEKSENG